jgi:hypothetical protein
MTVDEPSGVYIDDQLQEIWDGEHQTLAEQVRQQIQDVVGDTADVSVRVVQAAESDSVVPMALTMREFRGEDEGWVAITPEQAQERMATALSWLNRSILDGIDGLMSSRHEPPDLEGVRLPTGPELSAQVAHELENSIPEWRENDPVWELRDNAFSMTFPREDATSEPRPESSVSLFKIDPRLEGLGFGGKVAVKVWEHVGLTCAIFVGPMGGYNGYCQMPPTHPYYEVDELEVPANVHGGITYTGSLGWIGFDTAHAGDYVSGLSFMGENTHHWTLEEVIYETSHMALDVALIRRIDLDSEGRLSLRRAVELISTEDLRAELGRREAVDGEAVVGEIEA